MLRDQIMAEMKQAMKDKDTIKLEAIRYLWSEIKNAEIDAKVELDDQAIHAIIKRELKKRAEAVEQMRGAGRTEMAEDEEQKMEIIKQFSLPEMSREDIERIVEQKQSEGITEFGSLMKAVMAETHGNADGKLVSEVVKQKLT